jgi:alpha-N-acetylglucosamine transferase
MGRESGIKTFDGIILLDADMNVRKQTGKVHRLHTHSLTYNKRVTVNKGSRFRKKQGPDKYILLWEQEANKSE